MEAPTAHAQRAEETPLTYLNKGQFYTINLRDNDSYDGYVTSTFRIMFHDDQHRNIARSHWKFWLGQQANPKFARAFDIGTARKQQYMNYVVVVTAATAATAAATATAAALTNSFIIFAFSIFLYTPDEEKSQLAGVKNIELKSFDRVTFQWNGRKGSKIFIRFNCLSTDFSRIKGVKGIPLRAHMESKIGGQPECIERSYCKVKLFRDKVISFGINCF